MNRRFPNWGSKIILILLPFCACLDVQSVRVINPNTHPGTKLQLEVDFSPPTTEGWEEGEVAYGLLCVRIPDGWQLQEGTWVIVGGKSGTIVPCPEVKPILEAGPGYQVLVLSSDQALHRGDMTGAVTANLTFLTSNKSDLFTLIFLGGVSDFGHKDVIWSDAALYRKDIGL